MIKKLQQAFNLVSNMGLRYVAFRVAFALRKKMGLLKRAFPTNPASKHFIGLEEWKRLPVQFFFSNKNELRVPKNATAQLKEDAQNILAGKLKFFSSTVYNLGKNYDWITNPDTGFQYDINKHWIDINDYSKEAGDIKYVWEKSRFSFVYTIIRYEHHFQQDMSGFIFSEIENWINANPVNMGPNYKCSQEISLRVLNWTYVLQYYKDSPLLTEQLFAKILNSIYRQMQHVYSNINFSRIAVRNNHAITETLALYLIGLLYPFLPEAEKWKQKGKQWFEQEVAYQVYPDGTFLQFSMNYHRVVIQLLTWAIALSKANNESFDQNVYDRAKASYHFLRSCMNDEDGTLLNYGANDGALFFPLNDYDFRDYRPQLEALGTLLNTAESAWDFEDKYWFGHKTAPVSQLTNSSKLTGTFSFKTGGYYMLRESDAMTFIRCGNHKDRPSQADNLHLDLWANGKNIMRDAGSYKYNTDDETLRYFFGTSSHNTVMLNGHDQMQKGGRFIWYNWSGNAAGKWKNEPDYEEFAGQVEVFKHVATGTVHKRIVRKYHGQLKWDIIDELITSSQLPISQIWNPSADFDQQFIISATDKEGNPIAPTTKPGWYSGKYGSREASVQVLFTTPGKYIHTTIQAR